LYFDEKQQQQFQISDNDKHLFDIMATGPKSTYVTINISTEHVTVY